MSEPTRDELLDMIRETLIIFEPPYEGMTRRLAIHLENMKELVEPPKPELSSWPRTRAVYLHSSKETMYEHGSELGLTGEALDKFTFALYELTLELAVNQDGTYKIVRIAE